MSRSTCTATRQSDAAVHVHDDESDALAQISWSQAGPFFRLFTSGWKKYFATSASCSPWIRSHLALSRPGTVHDQGGARSTATVGIPTNWGFDAIL